MELLETLLLALPLLALLWRSPLARAIARDSLLRPTGTSRIDYRRQSLTPLN